MTDILPPITDTVVEWYAPADVPIRRRRTRRTLTAVDIVVVGLVTYLAGAALNASDLQRLAQRQPLGNHRDVAMMLADQARQASHTIGLDRPGRFVESVRGVPDPGATTVPTRLAVAASLSGIGPVTPTMSMTAVPIPRTTLPSSTTTLASDHSPAVTWPVNLTTTAPTSTTTTTTIAPRPLFFPGSAVAYWYGGDSLAQGMGQSLTRRAEADHASTVAGKGVISTGLARPDVFDWSATVNDALLHKTMQVAVIMLGANDDQALQRNEQTFEFGTPEWSVEYRARVSALMTHADSSQVRLLWIGLPPVRQASLDSKLKVIDDIFRTEASHHPHTSYLDLRLAVGSPEGGYDPYCHDEGSSQVLCRSNDGVHFTDTGYDRLSDLVIARARSLKA